MAQRMLGVSMRHGAVDKHLQSVGCQHAAWATRQHLQTYSAGCRQERAGARSHRAGGKPTFIPPVILVGHLKEAAVLGGQAADLEGHAVARIDGARSPAAATIWRQSPIDQPHLRLSAGVLRTSLLHHVVLDHMRVQHVEEALRVRVCCSGWWTAAGGGSRRLRRRRRQQAAAAAAAGGGKPTALTSLSSVFLGRNRASGESHSSSSEGSGSAAIAALSDELMVAALCSSTSPTKS